jgi:hypothetical protein
MLLKHKIISDNKFHKIWYDRELTRDPWPGSAYILKGNRTAQDAEAPYSKINQSPTQVLGQSAWTLNNDNFIIYLHPHTLLPYESIEWLHVIESGPRIIF